MKEAMGMPSSEKPLSGNEVLERYKESPDFKLKLVAVIAQGFDEKEISPKEDELADDYYKRIDMVMDGVDFDMREMQKDSESWEYAKAKFNTLLELLEETPTTNKLGLPKFDPSWNKYEQE